MTDTLTLHHVPASRSFRIIWLIEEMRAAGVELPALEIETYAIADGSLRRAEFLSRSPAGRVPALDVDGVSLFESGAIIEYLCERHPEAQLAPAPRTPERAAFLQWLHFAETMANLIANMNMQYLFLRDPAMRSPTVLKMEARRLEACIGALEAGLAGQEWLLKSEFSAVDCMLGYNLSAAPYFVKLDAYPNVRAYFARMEAREAYQAARRQDGPSAFYTRDFYAPDDTQ